MQARFRGILIGIGIVGAVAAATWLGAVRSTIAVETAVVARADFEELIVEEGRTRARWHFDVTAPVNGVWNPEGLRAADTVRAGALLGTLTSAAQDPSVAAQAQARVGAARATLTASRAAAAEAALAARDAARLRDRTERLVSAGGVSDAELERVRTADESAKRQVELTQAQVTASVFDLRAAEAFVSGGAGRAVPLRASLDGVVLRVDEEHERVVMAGTPLLQFGALGELEVVARLLSADAPRVALGATLYVIVGRDTLRGRVTRVEPTAHTVRSALGVEEQRVNVIGDLHVDSLRLGHDFQVQVQLVVRRLVDQVVVPSGALVRRGGAWSVFVLDETGRASERSVDMLARGADRSAVRGLEAGEVVVLYPPDGVSDGVRIRIGTPE